MQYQHAAAAVDAVEEREQGIIQYIYTRKYLFS